MSFILDALKKSETERQRHNGPSMAEIPYGRRRSAQPLWMILIVALLLVNLGVLTFWLWRKDAQPAAPAVAPPAPAQAAPAAAAPTPAVASTPAPTAVAAVQAPPEVRPLSTEADGDASIPAEMEEGAPAPVADEPKLVRRATVGSGLPPNARMSRAGGSSEGLPTLDALGGAGNLNLPPMHLDILVYSGVPAERFAFINMHKYTEGQTLNEGPAVERIANDGVVLNHRGQRFLLPR